MKILLSVLVLIFSLQSWTKADDIRDFEIESMSIGDSLLDHVSKELILKENQNVFDGQNNKSITSWVLSLLFILFYFIFTKII